MNEIVILTSTKNFQWLSMQEIIPFIEQTWISNLSESEVKIVDIDNLSFKEILKETISAKSIVSTCFTVELSKVIGFLRDDVGLDFKLFFYVHGLASVAMWPLLKWDLAQVMTQNDYFVVSCQNDTNALKLAFPNANIIKHEFFLPINKSYLINTVKDYVYIGRVSEQKNIHSMITLVSLLKEQGIIVNLDIIGKYDNLGSPNMALVGRDYDLYLTDLCERLEVSSQVKFLGFYKREAIDDYLENKQRTLLSLSLHSDENFGAVPYLVLKHGGSAILSNWGGYRDHCVNYKSACSAIDVYNSEFGPFVDLNSAFDTLLSDSKKKPLVGKLQLLNVDFSPFLNALRAPFNPQANHLEISNFAREILAMRDKFYQLGDKEVKNFGSQVFSSYQDENALKLFEAYGAKKDVREFDSSKKYRLCYDVEYSSENRITVIDPHRGRLLIETQESGEVTNIKSIYGECYDVDIVTLEKLYRLGCVFAF